MNESVNRRAIVDEAYAEITKPLPRPVTPLQRPAPFAGGKKKPTPAPAPPRSTGAAHVFPGQKEYEATTPGQDAAAARRGDNRAKYDDEQRARRAEAERRRAAMMRLHEPLTPPPSGGARMNGPTPGPLQASPPRYPRP